MAVKVYSLSSRIPVKIGDVVFKLSPFSQAQKLELAEFTKFEAGEYVQNASRLVFRALKYSIKDVIGLEDAVTGEPYKLSFDEAGVLTDESVNDLLNLELAENLVVASMNFMKGIPTEILDHRTGQKLEGIEILPAESALKKN